MKTQRFCDRYLSTRYRYRQYFLIYTILFLAVCTMVFSWYFLTGRTLIWQGDGWTQHYRALVYYAKYLRSILRNIIYEHRLVVPQWDFSLGEGNDILQTLHYYVMGDPFAFFSVFIPTRFLYLYYDFMILTRMYLAGVAFSCLCFHQKRMGRCAVMAGTLTYVFCYWAIYNAARHPYFLNPMIYFPMLVMGIEKILRKEKPYLFILSVGLSAVSNFYFFYMLSLLTAVYAVIRLLTDRRIVFRQGMGMLFRLGGAACLGVLMGCVVLVPVCFGFLGDARMSAKNAIHLFYPLSYYSALPGLFIAEGDSYWMCMGYAAPVVLAVILLFLRRGRGRILKVCFLVSTVMMLFPVFGQVLNGLSYMCNRWSWAFALLCAYILAEMWPDLMDLGLKDSVRLACGLTFYFCVCMLLEYSRTTKAFVSITIALLFLFLVFPFGQKEGERECWREGKQIAALFLVVAGIGCISFFKNASTADHYAREAKSAEEAVGQLMLNDSAAVANIADKEVFYRYSGRGLVSNAGLLAGISSMNYYWTNTNPYVSGFRSDMELSEPVVHFVTDYDDRPGLLTLGSVLYYVVPAGDNAPAPYGFAQVDTVNVKADAMEKEKTRLREELDVEELSEAQAKVIEDMTALRYKVYQNENPLPIGYTYGSVMDEDEWMMLSPIGKEEAMLQAVLLEGYEGQLPVGRASYTDRVLEHTVELNGNGITMEGDTFFVTAPNSTATIRFKGLEKSGTFFRIRGLRFSGTSRYDLYFGDRGQDPLDLFTETRWGLLPYAEREAIRKEKLFWTEPTHVALTLRSSAGASRKLNYYTEDYSYYSNRHNFMISLGYGEEAVDSIVVTFPSAGVYSFDSLEVICQPMEGYAERVAALSGHVLEDVEMGADSVVGEIFLTEPAILCLAIPYSVGWRAYVDGEEAELYRANIRYMAVELGEGRHKVELEYSSPLWGGGMLLSACGFGIFFILVMALEGKLYHRTRMRGDGC